MHRGCFVWTPTPLFLGRRTPRPGPARVCVCVPCLAGSGGPVSWARSRAPYLSFCRFWFALCLLHPLRARVAPFVVVVGFLLFSFCFFFFFPFPTLVAPSLCPALRVVRPWVPWALAFCRPLPPLLFLPPPPCCLWRFLLSGCLGPLRPPPLFFLVSFFSCFSFFGFFSFFRFFLPVVRCGAGLCVLGRRVCPRLPRWCCPCPCSVCAG